MVFFPFPLSALFFIIINYYWWLYFFSWRGEGVLCSWLAPCSIWISARKSAFISCWFATYTSICPSLSLHLPFWNLRVLFSSLSKNQNKLTHTPYVHVHYTFYWESWAAEKGKTMALYFHVLIFTFSTNAKLPLVPLLCNRFTVSFPPLLNLNNCCIQLPLAVPSCIRPLRSFENNPIVTSFTIFWPWKKSECCISQLFSVGNKMGPLSNYLNSSWFLATISYHLIFFRIIRVYVLRRGTTQCVYVCVCGNGWKAADSIFTASL